jgi:hypothetical protein
MAKFWILGDSWGTPLGLPPWMKHEHPHLEELLIEAGHTVVNFAECAGSNNQSINRAIKQIKKHPLDRPDWIIWFHTESLRDFIPGKKKFSIPLITRKHARQNYDLFATLLARTRAKDIIIGGQAPVLVDFLKHQPTHLIVDWRCELLGLESIPTHSVCHNYLFEHELCDDSYENRLNMLKEHDVILTAEKNSADFPDDCHPGGTAHQALFERIQPLIHK